MSKNKIILIIIIAIILVGGLISGYFVMSRKNNRQDSSQNLISDVLTQIKTVSGDLEYKDSSGFSFKHPKDIKVTDVTPDDDIHYSVLNLTKDDKQIIITVVDTKETTVDGWVKKESKLGNPSLVGATLLSGISAKQYVDATKYLTVAIDRGVLYLIEGPKDNSFWENTQNLIVRNFSLTESSQETKSGDSAIYEEEEIVE